MRAKRTATGAALAAGALAVTGLALAPSASAVTPQTATITASCGIFGGGTATLTATQSGTSATLSLTSTAITAPVTVAADSITSTLTMARAGGGSVVFSGTKNPVMDLARHAGARPGGGRGERAGAEGVGDGGDVVLRGAVAAAGGAGVHGGGGGGRVADAGTFP
nr:MULTISPECIES: hypothetical protein [Streptomyces]